MEKYGFLIWIFIFVAGGGTILLLIGYLIYTWFKTKGRAILKNILRTTVILTSLVPSVYRALSKGSYIVDVVFKTYVFFYKKNIRDIDNWGFSDDFPHGKTDIYNMFVWIQKERGKNYKMLKRLERSYHPKLGKFIFDKERWDGFDFAIKNGKVVITPFTDKLPVADKRKETLFNKEVTSLAYSLMKLDSEMCKWIIDRRQYFGI